MQSFTLLASLSALAAHVSALCNEDLFAGLCVLDDWVETQAAFDNSASTDFEWQIRTASQPGADYTINMVRLVGDAAGMDVMGQNTKQPVLFYSESSTDCFDWITEDTTAGDLFNAGYDVYIGCRRGQAISAGNPNMLTQEAYWNFDIEDVGKEDVTAMIEKITMIRNDESSACLKTAIVTVGLAEMEVLAAAANFPNSFDNFVSNVIGIAPCVISNLAEVGEPAPLRRALDMEEEVCGPDEEYWTGVTALCAAFPETCYDYCELFPYYCDEFCDRNPEFCRPARVDDFEQFLEDMRSLGYYAVWNGDDVETWAEKVAAFCLINDGRWCDFLQDTVDDQTTPDGLKQFEHFFQTGYTGEFDKFSDTWFMTGWQEDADNADVDLTVIPTKFDTLYGQTSAICKIPETKEVFEDVSNPGYFVQFNSDDLNSIDNAGFAVLVNALLAANDGITAPADCTAFGFTD